MLKEKRLKEQEARDKERQKKLSERRKKKDLKISTSFIKSRQKAVSLHKQPPQLTAAQQLLSQADKLKAAQIANIKLPTIIGMKSSTTLKKSASKTDFDDLSSISTATSMSTQTTFNTMATVCCWGVGMCVWICRHVCMDI
jgi:hypothetical protein